MARAGIEPATPRVLSLAAPLRKVPARCVKEEPDATQRRAEQIDRPRVHFGGGAQPWKPVIPSRIQPVPITSSPTRTCHRRRVTGCSAACCDESAAGDRVGRDDKACAGRCEERLEPPRPSESTIRLTPPVDPEASGEGR